MSTASAGWGTSATPAEVIAVIPARLDARRLPGKPLLDLGGAPLVWRVYERVRRCRDLSRVIVATDSPHIVDVVRALGGEAVLVDAPCASGTERVARAAAATNAPFVINVQGDEPFVDPIALSRLAQHLRAGATLATLAAPLPPDRRYDPATVKVVRDAAGDALYFSRAPIPGDQHLGVYGFGQAALRAVSTLPRGPLSRAEDLEQLAWLEAGWRIAVVDAPRASVSIDTPADLDAARAHFAAAGDDS